MGKYGIVDAGEDEVVVVAAEEVAEGALGAEEDLGVLAVELHVLQALGAVVAAGAGVVVRDAGPAELVVRHSGRRDEPDRVGLG